MKLVVIADHPTIRSTVEGYLARVKEIDKCMVDVERVYLSVAYKRNFRKIKTDLSDKVSVLELNVFVHFLYIFVICFVSERIFVHSVHNLKKAPAALLFAGKMIVDLHGLVSVEVSRSKWLYKFLECFVWRHALCVITVTQTMSDVFDSLFGYRKKMKIILPIHCHSPGVKGEIEKSFDLVYSGGIQEWQCIDQVVDLVKKFPSARVLILSPEIDYFTKIFKNDLHRVSIKYCTGMDYYDSLRRARYGFMLREDIPLNNVACPTKLIEYLNWGVVPILLSDKIGDFGSLGMKFVLLSEFDYHNVPSDLEQTLVRDNNYVVVQGLEKLSKNGLLMLRTVLR